MREIKCFETVDMPHNVYEYISGLLTGEDTCDFWIVDDDHDPPSPEIQWFLDNGGEYGEHVIIERGTWSCFQWSLSQINKKSRL